MIGFLLGIMFGLFDFFEKFTGNKREIFVRGVLVLRLVELLCRCLLIQFWTNR